MQYHRTEALPVKICHELGIDCYEMVESISEVTILDKAQNLVTPEIKIVKLDPAKLVFEGDDYLIPSVYHWLFVYYFYCNPHREKSYDVKCNRITKEFKMAKNKSPEKHQTLIETVKYFIQESTQE